MRRRELLKYAGATALAAPSSAPRSADTGTVKIGVVGAKTGPLAPGAAATFFPPWQLWAHQVNQAGGLKLKRRSTQGRADRVRRPYPAAGSDQGDRAACRRR